MASALAATSFASPLGWNTAAGALRAQRQRTAGEASSTEAPTEARGANAPDAQANEAEQARALQREIERLSARDKEVRAHEQAHMAAGAGLVTRGANYTYVIGPDGRRYATGGEVGIDTSPGQTPQETIAKAQRIRAAAMAPAQPSGQDMQVAAQAMQMQMQAQMELMLQRRNAAYSRMAEETDDSTAQRRAQLYAVA